MTRLFSEETSIVFRDCDANTTTNTFTGGQMSTAWLDMKDWNRLTVVGIRTVGNGKLVNAAIHVSASSTGSSSVAVTSIGSTNATGLLNQATAGGTGTSGAGIFVLDCTHDDIAAVLENGRYVSLKTTQAAVGDEFGIAYIRSQPRYASTGLLASGNG
jgi:hypothetical protein